MFIKKLMFTVFVLSMFVFLNCFVVYGQDTSTISISDISSRTGDTNLSLLIELNNTVPVLGFDLEISYPSVLDLENTDITFGSDVSYFEQLTSILEKENHKIHFFGIARFIDASKQPLASGSHVLANINVSIKSDALPGNYNISWEITDVSTENGSLIAINADPGEVIVLPPSIVATPTFDPAPGFYFTAQTVTLTSTGATIYYTTDHTEPDESSTNYTGPISVAETTTIKAKAYKTDWDASDIASGIYTITGKVDTPTMDPPGGTYYAPQIVEFACTTAGATIYYTIDGSEPNEGSMEYTGPINIPSTTVIKAVAYKSGWEPSDISSNNYVVQQQPHPPVITTSILPAATENEIYSVFIEATDIDRGDKVTFSIPLGPDWLEIDETTGELSGTPLDKDTGSGIDITIRATDKGGLYASLDIKIDVIDINYAPVILTDTLPDAVMKNTYNASITIYDRDTEDKHSYELIVGPEWLTIDSDSGNLTGTPSNEDSGNGIILTIQVSDLGGLKAEFTTTINVYMSELGVFSGTVVEKSSGIPVENALVKCGSDLSATTDADGNVEIRNIPPGTYNIEIIADKYQPYSDESVVIVKGMTTQQHIKLHKSIGFGAVAGYIIDLNTDDPLENAAITVTPGGLTTTSNADGYYILEKLQAGTNAYGITASARNYNSYTTYPVYVDNSDITTVTLQLAEIYTPQADSIDIEMDDNPVVGENEKLTVTTTINLSSIAKRVAGGSLNKNSGQTAFLYVAGAEMYFDQDPGVGNGSSMEAIDGAFDEEIEQVTLAYDISDLVDGTHKIYVRGLNSEEKWGYPSTSSIKKGLAYEPPLSVETYDVPDDNGHQIGVKWTASESENEGSVSGYRVYRSRNSVFNDPIPLSEITSIESLTSIEQNQAVLLDSVSVGITEYIDDSVYYSGVLYFYWIQTIGSAGASKLAPNADYKVFVSEAVSVPYKIHPPYPNPFNPSTTIPYSIKESGMVDLTVFNILGQEVRTLVGETQQTGTYSVQWNGRNDSGEHVSGGLYLYRLKVNGFVETKKMLLMK